MHRENRGPNSHQWPCAPFKPPQGSLLGPTLAVSLLGDRRSKRHAERDTLLIQSACPARDGSDGCRYVTGSSLRWRQQWELKCLRGLKALVVLWFVCGVWMHESQSVNLQLQIDHLIATSSNKATTCCLICFDRAFIWLLRSFNMRRFCFFLLVPCENTHTFSHFVALQPQM